MFKERYSLGELVDLVTSNAREKETTMISIAQAYKEEALQQGMQQEKSGIAKQMLCEGEAIEKVVR